MWPARWSNEAREHQEKWRLKKNIGPIGLFSQKTLDIKFTSFFNATRQTPDLTKQINQ
jgi:hypothetical protein